MNQLNQTREILNLEQIKSAIEPQNLRNLVNLEIFSTLDSTNTYLLAQAKAGAPSGSFCFAEQQTAGRGRRGRQWYSPPGSNIYSSALWRFPDESVGMSGLSIAVAVMVANALKKFGILHGLQLKWPNDVWFNGRKLAGILLERSGASVVIGIGLNLYLPSDTDSSWIAVQEIIGREVTRNYLAGLLVNELLAMLPVFQTQGLRAFIQDWRQYDVLINKPITVHAPDNIFSGVMRGINDQGELILQDDNGQLQHFCYGEISIKTA